ncbi:transposase (plasmid) [Paracoccus aminophilus JCM 7686]|uniref:Transposase n=1 Tax=Paracoccus aminophilus JCM 7686 TaxID=1367847 RepID=S5XU82_PARAH|nr:transposase [Paracoccus aminophilus JCM 7686]
MRFAFIVKHRHIWPVIWLCEVLEVSRSGFHAWLRRPPRTREIHEAKLVAAIKTSFKTSDRTYGARRVWRDVLEEGLACGLHRIERLMRTSALRARPRRRGKPKDDGERSVIVDNILDRDFLADRPNQQWLADFTYIWTAEGWLYVAVVLDLFSRRAVGWSMKADRDASLIMDALMMAVWRRGKADTLFHHSDQGSQYISEQFQRLWADNRITCSMSRGGKVRDNSAMESFFSTLKTERTASKVYRTRNEARADVFDYIERFYNPRRRVILPVLTGCRSRLQAAIFSFWAGVMPPMPMLGRSLL